MFFNQLTGIEEIIASLASGTGRIALTRYNLNGQSPVDVPLTTGMLSARDADLALQVDFGPNGIGGDPNGLQGDGYYRLSIDADNDAAHTRETDLFFYRLAGDLNHDRRVDSLDLTALNNLLANPAVAYDVNGDGVIDAKDQADADVNGDGSVTSADRLLVMRGRNRTWPPSCRSMIKCVDLRMSRTGCLTFSVKRVDHEDQLFVLTVLMAFFGAPALSRHSRRISQREYSGGRYGFCRRNHDRRGGHDAV